MESGKDVLTPSCLQISGMRYVQENEIVGACEVVQAMRSDVGAVLRLRMRGWDGAWRLTSAAPVAKRRRNFGAFEKVSRHLDLHLRPHTTHVAQTQQWRLQNPRPRAKAQKANRALENPQSRRNPNPPAALRKASRNESKSPCPSRNLVVPRSRSPSRPRPRPTRRRDVSTRRRNWTYPHSMALYLRESQSQRALRRERSLSMIWQV